MQLYTCKRVYIKETVMKKFIVFLTLFASILNAQMLKEGSSIDEFNKYEYKTPYDKKIKVEKNTKLILISFEKDVSAMVNEYLATKEKWFLTNRDAVFISDINKMPSIITKMFALPKLKKYKHPMYLHYEDEFEKIIPKKDEAVTLIRLKEGKVESISYIRTEQELEKVF